MRRATADMMWLTDDSGKLIGISLGADFCAEHEHGVKGLRALTGTPLNTFSMVGMEEYLKMDAAERSKMVLGIDSISTTKAPKMTYVEYMLPTKGTKIKTRAAYLHMSTYDGSYTKPRDNDAQFYDLPGDSNYAKYGKDMVTSWSEDGLLIHVLGEENIAKLRTLFKGFNDCNIIFGGAVSAWNRKSGRGLSLGLRSEMTQEFKDSLMASDLAKVKLYEHIESIGIIKRLQEAKCGWYALAPQVFDDGTLKFFLNPQAQRENNSGWMTVQDLEDWIVGEGKIPKNPKTPSTDMTP